ncbi:MAG: hypothetical protein KUG78_11895 [Kangiellaceae bacterium]|nr:hypothetical protein [Kangiellaceae bacterium]
MLPNCKQMAELASKNLDTPLTGMAWLKRKIHMLMCKHCSRYSDQIKLSSKTVSTLDLDLPINEDVKKNVEKTYQELHCRKDVSQ